MNIERGEGGAAGPSVVTRRVMEDTKQKIRAFLGKHLRGHDVGDDDNIFAEGLLNSLLAMQIVQFVEQDFDIQIDNGDLKMDNFRTINAMAALIEGKTSLHD
jgi:acyl carrier protein